MLCRQQLGIGMSGQQRMQHLINVHFTSPLLGAQLRGRMQRPGAERGSKEQGQSGLGADHKAAMLYFVFNSDVVTVVVAHDLQQGEFVAQVRMGAWAHGLCECMRGREERSFAWGLLLPARQGLPWAFKSHTCCAFRGP